jgi:LCP family protein required for cell wall assembly
VSKPAADGSSSYSDTGNGRGSDARSVARANTTASSLRSYRRPRPAYRARPTRVEGQSGFHLGSSRAHRHRRSTGPHSTQPEDLRTPAPAPEPEPAQLTLKSPGGSGVARNGARYRTTRILLVLALCLVLCAGGAAEYLLNQTIGTVTTTMGNVLQTPESRRLIIPTPPTTPGEKSGDAGTGAGQVPSGTPPVVEQHQYPDWSKQDPVNILLIGVDLRPQEQDTRADTQIVVHIDPSNRTAAMISIPRDLWVDIPSFGMDRVNAAFERGYHAELTAPGTVPGGGPGLAMSTIESDFGIPVDYYAWVNFSGFEKIVDTLGGVNVDVPRPLVDNAYPLADNSYGATRIYIPAGLQHMDGKLALEYARSRHQDSDLGRNFRQQQILLGLRQQITSLSLLVHFEDLASELNDSVRTDLSLDQLGSLAQLAKRIDVKSIATCQIDGTMVTDTILPSGADVLMPQWDLIHSMIQRCFADPALVNEAARISVQNGTLVAGTGGQVQDLLASKGLNVVDLSNAGDRGKHPITTIVDYTSGRKPHTLEIIQQTLGLQSVRIQQGNPADAPVATQTDGRPVDILVIAGDDRVGKK